MNTSTAQTVLEFLKRYKNEDRDLERRTQVSKLIDDAEKELLESQPEPIPTEIADEDKRRILFPVKDWNYEKKEPEFHVFGVQMLQNQKLAGTALYASMPRARLINDILNQEYARLKTENYEAKIMPYPVY